MCVVARPAAYLVPFLTVNAITTWRPLKDLSGRNSLARKAGKGKRSIRDRFHTPLLL